MSLVINTIAALAVTLAAISANPAAAQSLSQQAERQAEVDELMAELAQPNLETWESTETRLINLWSRSGSDTADLLLQRGQDALENEDYGLAVEHLTALTDHAPDFAEGWHARATAFYSMEEFGLALADLERALALNPQHFGALTGLGIVLEELGYLETALDAMRMAEAINPHRQSIRQSIERLRDQLGRASL
ncbi:MAG: tetratricopeptide repeat protein [Pseudomonadota bacterium]